MTPSHIPIKVLLGNDLKTWVDEWNPHSQQLSWRIETKLEALLANLGIPGSPMVKIKHSPKVENLQVFGHDKLLAYPILLVQRLVDHSAKSGFDIPKLTSSWTVDLAVTMGGSACTDFLSQLVIEIIKLHANVMMGDKQVSYYLSQPLDFMQGRKYNNLPRIQVREILSSILELKISIIQSKIILNSIVEAGERSDVEIIETLANKLNPRRVEIGMSQEYIKSLFNIELNKEETLSVYDQRIAKESSEQFKMLTDALFYELGMRVPDIVLTIIDTEGYSLYFKLNDFWCAPQQGIAPGQLLVNETKDELEFEAETATNPANDNECSLIKESDRQQAEDLGLQVWNPVGYLILALSRELRQNAGHLLHLELVEYELAQLDQVFPEIVQMVREKVSTARLTRVLRTLLDEEISIRDQRTILERVLTCDYFIFDAHNHIVFDDRLAFHVEPTEEWQDDGHTIAQYVRIGLKRYISHKYTRGQSTLIVYLIDPEIEKILFDHLAFERGDVEKTALSAERTEKIRETIRIEIGNILSTSVSLPPILTLSEIRYVLRSLIAREFPGLTVLSYEELSANMNIQPIARISL